MWQPLKRIVPISFVLGAAMELFMIKTGFYDTVRRKKAEERLEQFKVEESRGKALVAAPSQSEGDRRL